MPEIIESLESRSIQTSGGRGTGKRSFFAKGYSSPADVFATLGRTVGSVNVPDKGEAFPGLPGLIARFCLPLLFFIDCNHDFELLIHLVQLVHKGIPLLHRCSRADDNFSLKKRTTYQAISELIRQMLADSKTVDGNTVSVAATSAGGSNVGNGTMVFSEVAPLLDTANNRPGNLHVRPVES